MKNLKNINIGKLVTYIVFAWLIITFLIYPNLNILLKTFVHDGKISTLAFKKLMSSTRAVNSMKNSFILAFTMVITVNIVGTFLVLVTEYFEIKGSKILKLGYMTTLVYGGIVLVAGYKFIYGTDGFLENFINNLFQNYTGSWFNGYMAVAFIMTFACTSNHIIFLSNAIKSIDQGTIEAARNMGASQITIIKNIVLPVLKPTFFSVTILTFLTGLSAISAPLVVGGKKFQTINPMILQFAKTQTSRDIAALLAIILGISTLILLLFMNHMEKKGNYISVSKVKSTFQKQKINNKILNTTVHILAYLLFIIYTAPLFISVLFSFTNSLAVSRGEIAFKYFTLENYITLFSGSNAIKPYLVSITYSILAAIIVAIICLVASKILHKNKSKWASVLELSLLIPWLLPATLIALGLLITYDLPQGILFNKVLIGTPVIMLIAYIIVKIPFSLRMIRASFFGLDSSLEEAAKSMGASSIRTFFQVIFPVLLPNILAVVALTFNSLLADYDLSVFLYYPAFEPLGVIIKKATEETAGQNAKAMIYVYTVIVLIMSSLSLYFVYGRKNNVNQKK